jgi:hypothetical protein
LLIGRDRGFGSGLEHKFPNRFPFPRVKRRQVQACMQRTVQSTMSRAVGSRRRLREGPRGRCSLAFGCSLIHQLSDQITGFSLMSGGFSTSKLPCSNGGCLRRPFHQSNRLLLFFAVGHKGFVLVIRMSARNVALPRASYVRQTTSADERQIDHHITNPTEHNRGPVPRLGLTASSRRSRTTKRASNSNLARAVATR